MNISKILFISVLLSLCLPSFGQQNDSVRISIYPFDAFSEKLIENAKITIYEADSITVLVDSIPKQYWNTHEAKEGPGSFAGYWTTVPRKKRYVISVEHDDYTPRTEILNGPSRHRVDWARKDIYLFKNHETQLGEASVTASRILMVVKGDTIVYNAAAFKMAEGSMLDGLVRSLPGVKLDENGRITVNGQFVSSLLVNGRDFFKGNPKVALNNLPAYVVNKIKVYRRNEDNLADSLMDDEEKKSLPLVMDVGLKRQYAQSWIENFELAAGSKLHHVWDNVWMARMFAMRFTNHSSLAIFANANNLNDSEAPAGKGEWRKPKNGEGDKNTKIGGIDFTIEPKDVKMTFNTSLQVMRQTNDEEQQVTSVSYLSDGDISNYSKSIKHTTMTDLKWNAKLKLPKDWSPVFTFSVFFKKSERNDSTLAQQFMGDINSSAYYTPSYAELYHRNYFSSNESRIWGGDFSMGNGRKFGKSKKIIQKAGYTASMAYRAADYDNLITDHILYVASSTGNVNELRKTVQPSHNYNYQFGGNYSVMIKNKWRPAFEVSYQYTQTYNTGKRDLYRSENEEDGKANISNSLFSFFTVSDQLYSTMPSMHTSAVWITDLKNSYQTAHMEKTSTLTPKYSMRLPLNLRLSTQLDILFHNRRLHDFRNGSDNVLKKYNITFCPSIRLFTYSDDDETSLDYRMVQSLPDMLHLLDIRDDSDPLEISIGNSNLRRSTTHSLSFTTAHYGNYSAHINFLNTHNAVGMAKIYNRTTGITMWEPHNVSGNWKISADFSYTTAIDKKKRLYLEINPNYSFYHSVDFNSDSGESLQRLAVDNQNAGGELQLKYNTERIRLGAKIMMERVWQTSKHVVFITNRYMDYNCGLTLTSPLLWGFDLDTDLMVYCRRGYSDASMNTTEWVWNASLSKAFGRRKQWLVKAVGFDLFSQLSNVRKVVNAQGRTETRYNTMPSYATLHIVYRLDIKPKKN